MLVALVVEGSGDGPVAGAGCGSLRTLATGDRFGRAARAAIAARRKPQARGARPQSRPQRRAAPGKHCPSHGAKRVLLLRSRKSLQLGVPGHSAGRRSARRRCALETVEKVVTPMESAAQKESAGESAGESPRLASGSRGSRRLALGVRHRLALASQSSWQYSPWFDALRGGAPLYRFLRSRLGSM